MDKDVCGHEKEWENEPDYKEFEVDGYLCVIIRNKGFGTLCGYVSIPRTHPLYGKSYSDTVDQLQELAEKTLGRPADDRSPVWNAFFDAIGNKDGWSIGSVFDVHGGLTYSGDCLYNNGEKIHIRHGWWFGFDCGHCRDYAPAVIADTVRRVPDPKSKKFWIQEGRKNTYRNIAYVEAEVRKLAKQLHEVEDLFKKKMNGDDLGRRKIK